MKSRQKSLRTLLLVALFIFIGSSVVNSQEVLTIKKTDNTIISIPTSDIVSITFEGSAIVSDGNTVTDADGNIYNTVTIGYQTWLGENLKTTKYNDGRPIKNIRSNEEWANTSSGAYCWYENSSTTRDIFGGLYNWEVIKTNKLCPKGWRVPTTDDFNSLGNYLGGHYAGAELKEAGSTHWEKNDDRTTNSTNFTALPAGKRHKSGTFASLGTHTGYWSSTSNKDNQTEAIYHGLHGYNSALTRYPEKKQVGYSVRCIKE